MGLYHAFELIFSWMLKCVYLGRVLERKERERKTHS